MALVQRWSAAVSMGLVVGALLACKKKPDAGTEASAAPSAALAPAASASGAPSAAASASAAGSVAAPVVEAKLGDVKRYGVEKESRLDDAGVRVATDGLKVFDEADTTKDDVAQLPKDLLVFRQVKMGDFTLVEFPSGVGQFSQGWVETKGLSTTVEKVTRSGALDEKKTATVTVKDGGAPTPKTDAGAAKAKPEPPPVPDPKKAAAEKAAADKKAADAKAAAKKAK